MFTRRAVPFVTLLMCLLGTNAMAQEVREWTDLKGQKMSAKFLMLTPDQKLVLEAEGKTYFIPLDRFSQEDQDYARSLQEKPEKKEDSPPANMADSAPPSKKENLTENRLWTDFQGRQVKAKFLRMHEGRVILMQGSTPRPVSFYTLSQEDQDWLRKRLEERGEADQILTREGVEMFHPNIHDAMDAALAARPQLNSSSASPETAAGGSTDSGASRPPAYMPPDTQPYSPSENSGSSQASAPTDLGSTPQRRPLFLPPEQEQASPGPNEFGGTAPTANPSSEPEEAPSLPPTETAIQPTSSETASGFRNRFDRRRSDVQPGHCPNCRKELPQGVGPGDHCPRCRFYLPEDVSPGTGPPVEPWYKRYNLAMIGGIAAVVVGAMTLLSKKFQG